MNSSCADFIMHEAFVSELRAVIAGEWAALARLKLMVPIKVALERMLTAEDVLSFA